jgi:FKBP-type peptidyl-prolyl cis-trans isomerase SlpA
MLVCNVDRQLKAGIESGNRVILHFSLTLLGGMVVDTSREGEPLSVVIGQGEMAEGLEKYLIGLSVGDRRSFSIPAGEVYGLADSEAIHVFARDEFPPEMTPEPGQVIGFTTPSGDEVPGLVQVVDKDGVKVDFSHPLAGHDLLFDVEIVSVSP